MQQEAPKVLVVGAMGIDWAQGAWSETDWFRNNLLEEQFLHSEKVIYQLEMFAILMAFRLWGHTLGGGTILLRSDNKGVCHSINNQSSNLTAVMELIRELTLLSMTFQVMVKVLHICGWKNLQSNQLSQFQMSAFWRDFK